MVFSRGPQAIGVAFARPHALFLAAIDGYAADFFAVLARFPVHSKRIARPFWLLVAWGVAVALSACDGGDPVEQGHGTASTADAAADSAVDGGDDGGTGDDGDGVSGSDGGAETDESTGSDGTTGCEGRLAGVRAREQPSRRSRGPFAC